MSVTELVGDLKAHKQRINWCTRSFTDGAFQSKHKKKISYNNRKKKVAGDKNAKLNNGSLSFKEPKSKGNFPLYCICQIANHLEKDC